MASNLVLVSITLQKYLCDLVFQYFGLFPNDKIPQVKLIGQGV
jgi:hypothetical protein